MKLPAWLTFRIMMLALFCVPQAYAQSAARIPGELIWAIRYDPKTFDPAKVDEQASETVRFLTGGVLLRFNRPTQQPQPELAAAWSISPDGHTVSFRLREGLRFSDGSSLTSNDVAWSLRRVLDKATEAPVAEEFVSPQQVTVETPDPLTVRVHLPKRVIGIGKVFDEIAIEPANRPSESRVTSGAFVLADYKRGQSIQFKKNPYYWGRDGAGVQLPYASGIRLDILGNREQEVLRFERGQYDLIEGLPSDYYNLLTQKAPKTVHDLGPSLNTEQLWFNQAASAPLPEFERAWFADRAFRIAVSQAIHRGDLARIAYDSRATAAYNFISPANGAWYNAKLQYFHEDVNGATKRLADAGFRKTGGVLTDAAGHPVKFSILTNAGNVARQKMATLIQQDLAGLGMQVTVVALDFPALIERLMHKQDYEACLLGLVNVDSDPNSMMNLWLSSSPNHQWNPSEKTPATPWEAEIDKQMNLQAVSAHPAERKRAIDQVQQIVADQQPFIYLVYPNALSASSLRLENVQPTVFQPGLVWNINFLRVRAAR